MKRRLLAVASLVLMAAALVLAVVVTVRSFPSGVTVLACVVAAAGLGWWALIHSGRARTLAALAAAVLVGGAVALVVLEGGLVLNALVFAAFWLSLVCTRQAFARKVEWPEAARPEHPVLFFNPKSGGGKAERFHVADEARKRGIEPVELRKGDDLRELVEAAIARGADGLAMAGGDGSQAIVAAHAAAHGLPYACIPSGTRNHFALDLGVDRNDVVGALDAFVNGRERVVDLAEVNGQVFVNNVSLGVYAEAVQNAGYRNAKLRTLADTALQVLGSGAERLDLRWKGPDGAEQESGAVVLVSNDPYRLGRALGSGTRPRLDRGVLGIAVFGSADGDGSARMRMQEWSSADWEIASTASIAAGIDGEAVRLNPPLRFTSRPAALRVRIAPQHPGASPAAFVPDTPWGAVRGMAKMALSG